MQFLEKMEPGSWRLRVRVKPGAARDEILGLHGGRIKISIKAPPVDGKANKTLCSFLSRCLGVGKKQVFIERGRGSRNKDILVRGVPESVFEAFKQALES
ncbi:DUF167 domain-containing protein [Desulfonatronospira sp.]|uniref:DUF167 domain-containing protein n=1 Tax=Desulfonatronospira sp. TaxID=1962951 RepID=UPI0025B9F94E|nr:DUF167 domain-containing protein [Desulfonatronospira sp.]